VGSIDLSHSIARALRRSGVRPGDKVGILSANDPTAFSCVLGVARAGAVWCLIKPAQRRREEPGTAGPLRLHRADLPGLLCAGGEGDRRGPAGVEELTAFVKARIGSVKAPKQVEVWADLPRSKVGKVLKTDIKQQLQESATTSTSNPAGSAR
jgi:acyl-coenzyme A synthetase/AMP-(fatty) acid ligase